MRFGVDIRNLPDEQSLCTYIVARYVDGELWYWGSWDDEEIAKKVVHSELDNGIVVKKLY